MVTAAIRHKRFSALSYRGQVLRLRRLAERVLSRYPVRVRRLDFLHHGENTTFRARSADGRSYVLRIHRLGYHTEAAIREELQWLQRLAETGELAVPVPQESVHGALLETALIPGVDGERTCCLFRWLDGRFVRNSLTPRHMRRLGELTAELQRAARDSPVVHRRYWTAQGLVGRDAKFGSVDRLPGIKPRDRALLSGERERVYADLEEFERRFPQRVGLIHADLHFGNVLASKNGKLAAIDFDDCGLGFHAYDLAVSLLSAAVMVRRQGCPERIGEYKNALLSGYAQRQSWDAHDDAILDTLMRARRLSMLAWLHSRDDHPRLKEKLRHAVEAEIARIKRHAPPL